MAEEFAISPQMTKPQLIEEHQRLLDAYRDRARQAEEAEQRRADVERQLEAAARREAQAASPQGVIESLGALRGLLGRTLNDLVERMSAQAERLETLNRAIAAQERRLAELHDVEGAAESLSRLTQAYQERRAAAEAELAARVATVEAELATRVATTEAELSARVATTEADLEARAAAAEEEHRRRTQALEADHAQRRAKLEEETRRLRESWEAERSRTTRELAEAAEQRTRDREREESEHVYARDRARKLDEDAYQEHRAALERELKERAEVAGRELAARETAMTAREEELAELRRRVAAFPDEQRQAVEAARAETHAAVRADMERKAEMVALEREWERKVYEERVKHLQEGLAGRDEKLAELKAELAAALRQVQQLAEKTVEGASLARAFQSVNQIALEQARRPDGTG